MLQNFFSLDGNPNSFNDFMSFKNYFDMHDTTRNYIYYPTELKDTKIKIKTFDNVSFSKTTIENVEFFNCHFENCLFLGTIFKDCKFIECSFNGCNTYSIKLHNTYINPAFFSKNFKKYDQSFANIVVQLYQELYNNSVDLQLFDFSRVAKYNLLKWEGKLMISKYIFKKPYKISFFQFLIDYLPNFIYGKVFGYGLRLRNFIFTFSIIYLICFFTNALLWNDYKLDKKDIKIESFNSEVYNYKANIFYTTDVLTKIIDSQFQPTSNIGMNMLTVQGFLGFVLFSFLITLLINKFVK